MRGASALLLLSLFLAAPLSAAGLDGTQWTMRPKSTVQMVIRALVFWRSSKLSFAAGQFTRGKGEPIPYAVAQENGQTTWRAEKTGAKGEKAVWSGTVDGDQMTGATVFTRVDGKTTTREWTARRSP